MPNTLIVGAGSGVGLSLAESLIADGHELWTTSRSPQHPLQTHHQCWEAETEFPADTLPDTLACMVYCPGTLSLQPFSRTDLTTFVEDMEINLFGAVRALQAALPALQRSEQASVVLFSSVAATAGMPMHASIAAAKGGIEGITRALAAELAPGIRVNAVAPSLTDTPLASSLLRSDRQRENAAARHPLGRIGQPHNIVSAVKFLLSVDAAWITGQILAVDGGIGAVRRFA
ncbi:MAG: oxidoreductase [gamma proteobacterium symbiont of Ctena orbiculata]|uniref:SDR family oxidoreductase n=1 Tax=Candidatus Thiodiazotropha taylori TaxID=2792791 RepID=A0A944QX93_9GAMM|nr:SDR family oxidoreductase [Candidatus Thiodiazotropha taylori]PUB88278.1 MAG: oxidoreductase [gamma proteobacterium symbiont of Ctena orbiculata]MBT2991111.1 SDR family oxidoreductase [Candidatus Thiodiazotropha taylori]MBT2998725.1 SDR family oxidoreductase [Candidatus Thiodiazotropha taylori]MBT3002358.1 SDR family oxidoreductase [Candidatus Thiodiazotropha taylori]